MHTPLLVPYPEEMLCSVPSVIQPLGDVEVESFHPLIPFVKSAFEISVFIFVQFVISLGISLLLRILLLVESSECRSSQIKPLRIRSAAVVSPRNSRKSCIGP